MAPSSLQESSSGGTKSAKFIDSKDPLDPMINPFPCLNDEQKDVQQMVAGHVNERLENAMVELREKHRRGCGPVDDPDRAPTGPAYYRQQQLQQQQQQQRALLQQQREQQERQRGLLRQREQQELCRNVREQFKVSDDENKDSASDHDDDDDYDSDDDLLLEDDPALDAIRRRRLEQLRQRAALRAQEAARERAAGRQQRYDGEVRTISQDEFLSECCSNGNNADNDNDGDTTTTTGYAVVHFDCDEFERCKILNARLAEIARRHLHCKFLKIAADRAPFFVTKLRVRTLPTLLVFSGNGDTVGRLTGFEGLAVDPSRPDDWETFRLERWLAGTGAIDYDDEVRQKEASTTSKTKASSLYRGQFRYDIDD